MNWNPLGNVIPSYGRVGILTLLFLLLVVVLICLHFLFGDKKSQKMRNLMKEDERTKGDPCISKANLVFRGGRIRNGYIEGRMEGWEIRDTQLLLLERRTMPAFIVICLLSLSLLFIVLYRACVFSESRVYLNQVVQLRNLLWDVIREKIFRLKANRRTEIYNRRDADECI